VLNIQGTCGLNDERTGKPQVFQRNMFFRHRFLLVWTLTKLKIIVKNHRTRGVSVKETAMNWLEEIAEVLRCVDTTKIVEPKAEVDLGSEVVVGKADDYHMRFYSYIELLREEGEKKLLAAAQQKKGEEEKAELNKQVLIFVRRIDALKTFFWASIKETFSLWDADVVGLRKGWKIVAKPCDCPACTGRVGVRIISLG
jgi:hypothetical protein